MNKKITSSVLVALMIAGSTSFSAFASMGNGTVVIGAKAFDLGYANDTKNLTEISGAITDGAEVYVKNFNGNWIDNVTGKTVTTSVLPNVVYKDATGVVTNFNAEDTNADAVVDTVKPVVSSIKQTNSTTIEITYSEEVTASTALNVVNTMTMDTVVNFSYNMLRDGANTLVNIKSAKFKANTGNKIVVLTLESPLTLDREYFFVIKGVKDMAGNVIDQFIRDAVFPSYTVSNI